MTRSCFLGISGRSNPLAGDDKPASEERLQKLSSFQSVILKKALSFPNVKRVVYSTCSIHSKENEEVLFQLNPHRANKKKSNLCFLDRCWWRKLSTHIACTTNDYPSQFEYLN